MNIEDAIKEYGTASRLAGKDAWLLHRAERGEADGLEREIQEARGRNAEERVTSTYAALLDEVKRLRALMVEVYRDGYQAGVDGDESDVLDVAERLDEYLARLPPR